MCCRGEAICPGFKDYVIFGGRDGCDDLGNHNLPQLSAVDFDTAVDPYEAVVGGASSN